MIQKLKKYRERLLNLSLLYIKLNSCIISQVGLMLIIELYLNKCCEDAYRMHTYTLTVMISGNCRQNSLSYIYVYLYFFNPIIKVQIVRRSKTPAWFLENSNSGLRVRIQADPFNFLYYAFLFCFTSVLNEKILNEIDLVFQRSLDTVIFNFFNIGRVEKFFHKVAKIFVYCRKLVLSTKLQKPFGGRE